MSGFVKAYYANKEAELRANGIKHIKYTKYGVPLPDWDKILQEQWDRNRKEEAAEQIKREEKKKIEQEMLKWLD